MTRGGTIFTDRKKDRQTKSALFRRVIFCKKSAHTAVAVPEIINIIQQKAHCACDLS